MLEARQEYRILILRKRTLALTEDEPSILRIDGIELPALAYTDCLDYSRGQGEQVVSLAMKFYLNSYLDTSLFQLDNDGSALHTNFLATPYPLVTGALGIFASTASKTCGGMDL